MRTFDRVLAVLLAVAGLLLGGLVVVEVVVAALGRPAVVLPHGPVAGWLRENPWSAGIVVAIAVALLVLGLVLLLAELTPRRRTDLVLTEHDPAVTTTLSTRSLGRLLETAATATPGVERASARARARRARLSVHIPVRDAAEVARIGREAEANATSALEELQLRRTPKLRVRTRQEAR
ncbi:hypothetical protein JOD57_000523 [Geodermatophilus bullaregiensis]|uniref:DUF6286 domain-containing protein n=1 Tax=Geodermatophilus bullaregiensis TaxID=1564160 RepID=UPI00195DC0F5|nr:DUF6286 domain-containing protein [Geodermatophilus bullaregiensis]MBM7804686.1 hypothetical protein [Geodermatophilus bullaregiensis]